MENKNSKSKTTPQNGNQSKEKATKFSMESSQLMELFTDMLKDLYWAEKAITKAIPKMIENATSLHLIDALKSHLDETGTQITRLEQVFESVGLNATSKQCEAMVGIIEEGEELMETCLAGAMRDAGIISAAQKVEHYEIASYGTLRQFAEILGLTEAETLLLTTLNEEKAADLKLTEVAMFAINVEAAHQAA